MALSCSRTRAAHTHQVPPAFQDLLHAPLSAVPVRISPFPSHIPTRCPQAHRLRLLKGLRVYAEATLTHLPLSTDLRKLLLTATPRRAVASCPVADLLQKGAYPGLGCSYKKAARDMGGRAGGALVDPDGSCVYLPVGKAPHSALLQLDFAPRQGAGQGGGPALRVVTVKGQAAGSSGGRCE